MRPQLHTPTLVVTALVVGALANLAEYPSIERDAGDWYRAVRVKAGHTLPELGDQHFASTQLRFSVYLDLRRHAYGAVLELPRAAPLNGEQLVGLAGLEALELRDEEITITAEVARALDGDVVVVDEDEQLGGYAVAVPAGGDVDRLLLVRAPDSAYFVTPELLEAAGGEVGA